uniref:Kinectin n=1 Tax=Caenorhabditis tropicalis TaxID=1561998 RepID=A0A1I7TSP8_9PELO
MERIQEEHRTVMQWEQKVMQQTIDKLSVQLEEKNKQIVHLEERIKGEKGMIRILKKVIDESKVVNEFQGMSKTVCFRIDTSSILLVL